MIRSILVPLNGIPLAEQALPLAISIARRANAGIQLVNVAHPLPCYGQLPEVNRIWQGYLNRIAKQVNSRSAISVNTLVLEGKKVALTLKEHAEKSGTDLIVMLTHSRSAIGAYWLGSVAYEFLHCLPMPMLLVKPREGAAGESDEPVLNHILIPLDGSQLAERILEPATTFGRLMNADYNLVRVLDDVPTGVIDAVSLSSLAPQLIDQIQAVQKKLHKEAEVYIESVAQRMRGWGLQVRSQIVESPDAANAILDVSGSNDLIAMETHGRHGMFGFGLGSVARKVLRGATIPVLVQSAAASK